MPEAPATLAGLFALPADPATGEGRRLARRALSGRDRKLVEAEVKKATDVTREAAEAEVARAVRGLLDIPIPDVLAGGWRTLSAVRKIGAQSRAAPGKRFELALGEHEITSRHEPSMEIFVNERKVAEISCEAVVAFKIGTAVLVVRDGMITGIEAAAFRAQGAFSCGGAEIASVRSARLRLPAGVTFSPGIEIPE